MNPITLDVNKTTVFLLPILFPDSIHDEIFSNYFKQAYVGLLDSSEDIEYDILLEFDEDKVTPDLWSDITDNIQAPGAEVKSIDDNLITYTFDDEWSKTQYELFLKGVYSQFDDKAKKIILEFWKEDDNSLLYAILYNDSEKVEQYTPHLNKDIIDQLKETNGESWPAPNLFVDEFLLL